MPKDQPREGEGERRAERRSYDQLDRRTRLVAVWHVLGFNADEIAAHLATTRADVEATLRRLQELANGSD
jgi:DNA-directed RNA polymerase specialized sigma24 family protein